MNPSDILSRRIRCESGAGKRPMAHMDMDSITATPGPELDGLWTCETWFLDRSTER